MEKPIFKTKYDKTAEEIFYAVGQQINYTKVYNCMTRLRFTINNKEEVKIEDIKKLALVKGINWNGAELQIIIGGEVQKVKDAFDKFITNFGQEKVENNLVVSQNNDQHETKKSLKARMLGAISGVMVPTLPVFIAVGMLLGIKAIFVQTGVIPPFDAAKLKDMGVGAAVFHSVTEVAFAFLGIFIGYNTMKYLGGNTVMSILLGIAIANPYLMFTTAPGAGWPLFKIGETSINVRAFTNSILPHIAANVAYFYLDKWIKTWMPSLVDIIFRPLITYTVVIFALYFVLGPILFLVETGITIAVEWLGKIPYGIGVGIFALLWQPFVLTGMHVAVGFPIGMALINAPQLLYPAIMYGVYGQLGAMIAVLIRTKNAQLRKLALANLPAGVIGITEPIMYGINLPKFKPFIAGILGAGIAGIVSGNLGIMQMVRGGYGIFSIASFISGGLWNVLGFILCLGIAAGMATLIGVFMYTERKTEKKQLLQLNRNLIKWYAISKRLPQQEAKNILKNHLEPLQQVDPEIMNIIKETEKNYVRILSLKVWLSTKQTKLEEKIVKLNQKFEQTTTKYQKQSKNLEISLVKVRKQLMKTNTQSLKLKEENLLKKNQWLMMNYQKKTDLIEAKQNQLQQVNPEFVRNEAKLQEISHNNLQQEMILNQWQTQQLTKVESLLNQMVQDTQIQQLNLLNNSYYNAFHSLDINYEVNPAKEILFNKAIKKEIQEQVSLGV